MIPAWNLQGIIPPVRPGATGSDPDRSPYKVPLHVFVDGMANSAERLEIAEGLLQLRSQIHRLGITTGFQWLDGSFLENVEATEGRSPRDIDVVTFFEIPAGETETSLVAKNPQLFDHAHVKETFRVDSYWDVLGMPMSPAAIQQVAYWHSMWSHRRDGVWKGFVQVDLDAMQDPLAAQAIAATKAAFGVTP
ncbi:DUF6932 family protein [Roseateles sp. L2-2]|uniref:DUF6932 family protein n=1 Tax=Roseateles sp. L2-2 TaxID=3422597 RepID=UPI003D368F29